MNRVSRLAVSVAAALLLTAVVAASAFAHATLLGSKPRDGQVLERAPATVLLTFDEAIDTELVQLEVEDAAGRAVGRGEAFHPGGREELVAIRLRRHLEGTYVARYRVISEDGHPVAKSSAFRVRPAAAPEPMADAPVPPVMDEGGGHGDELTGGVTDTAFAAARGAGYLAIALAIGGAAFVLLVWMPALARHAHAGADWRTASRRFIGRLRPLLLGAVLLGLVATAVAIVLEAATAAGVSFWAALDADAVDSVSETQVVQAWGVRFAIWLVLGLLLVLALRPQRAPVLRRAALGAEGVALGPAPSRPQLILFGGALLGLAFTAPMAGHASTYSPEALLTCVGTAHVLCMSVWLGGLVMLLVAVPAATRTLSAREKTPLLAGVVARFSRMATIAVVILIATGVVQSIALVGSFPALVETGYGRLVLAKVTILLALVSLGAYNQRRSVPRLKRLAAGGEEPGRAAWLLRRAVAAEVAFLIVVVGVTSVLVATEPPG